jgi:hypothetical protein
VAAKPSVNTPYYIIRMHIVQYICASASAGDGDDKVPIPAYSPFQQAFELPPWLAVWDGLALRELNDKVRLAEEGTEEGSKQEAGQTCNDEADW